MFDGKAFGAEIVNAVKAYMVERLDPILSRLDSIERRLGEVPGDLVTAERLPEFLNNYKEYIDRVNVNGHRLSEEVAELRAKIESLPELPDVPGIIKELSRSIEDQRGQDTAQIAAWMENVEERLTSLPTPKDGKDADPEEVRSLIVQEVRAALEAIPAPQDGKSVTVEDVGPLVRETVSAAVAEAVKSIPVPKDGRDGLDAVTPLLKDGVLLFTMSDGSIKEVGRIQGENGKNGTDGRDGKDGVGFDNLDLVVADDGVALVFERGEERKAFALPIVFDRGVFKEGGSYRKGNGVTWGGQFWIAQKDAPEGKPDASPDWRLAVKKGRDARPAKVEVTP